MTNRYYTTVIFGLFIAAQIILVALSIAMGSISIPIESLFEMLLFKLDFLSETKVSTGHQYVIEHIRFPRTIFGIIIGASLSVAGAMMQGLFRNPLADPGLLGVSSGAALGAAVVIVLGFSVPFAPALTLPISAFLGGIIATVLVMRLSFTGAKANVSSMLLAGIAINAICGACTGLLVYISNDEQLRTLTFWTMGSLGAANWANLPYVFVLSFCPVFIALGLSRSINAMLLGESEAMLLGVNVEQIKVLIVVLVCIMVGTCVALTGLIGFVGLVVPHLCRLIFGPDNRKVILGSIFLGGNILLGADIISRTIVSPAELPIGIVTSIVGGPFFLSLLFSRKHLGGL